MTGYQSKKAAALEKLQCQCSMITKLVGSGCQYCNPEYMDDHIPDARKMVAQPAQGAAAFIAAEERKVCTRYGYFPKLHPSEYMDEQLAQEPRAMEREALKLALVVEEFDSNDESLPLELLKPIAEKLRALAQPAQEPVAWMYQCSDEFGWRDEIQFVQPPNHPVFRNVVALYTAPPQRPWVSLTEEEIDVIYEQHHNQYGECESPNFGYERAILKKSKEKNT
jgi:hypothetical protein